VIRLQMLGSVALEDPARPELRQLLSQPKPLALLCVLALAGSNRFSRRDTLVSLFWPDLDHEHARAALRQTLLVLRRCLGTETIVSRGDDEIGLDPDRFWCDALAFQQLSQDGDSMGAMRLYRGSLLDGIHVAGVAPELAQWLDAERLRLRRLAQQMAWRCMEQHQAEGVHSEACRWARRAVELEPFDEQGVRRLLQLLDLVGDRSGAVQEYELFAKRLARELEIPPSAETQALIASIRTRIPVMGSNTGSASQPPGAGPATPPPSQAAAPVPRASRLRWLLVPAAIAGLVLAFRLSAPGRGDRVALDSNLIALMPWRVSGADPGLHYLREGMLDLLDATLTGDRGLRAADPRTVVRALGRVASDSTAEVPLAIAVGVAERIGAGRLIQGAVVGTPGHLTLTATEFTTAHPRAPLAFSVSGTVDSLPWMIERLAAQILSHEAGDPAQIQGLSTTSLPALRLYLEGRAAYRQGLYTEASRDFDEALTIDSSFALAAVSQATGALTLANNDWIERGKRTAQREARRLSPRDRALVEDLTGPRYPAPADETDYLNARSRAVRLAPESPEAWYWLGDSYFHDGRLLAIPDWRPHAIAAFGHAMRLDSAYVAPYEHLIEIKLQAGDTVGIRRLASVYMALDSTGEYGDYVRWRVAVGLGDSSGLADLRARFDHMSIESLYRIVTDAQLEGIELPDAERAAASLFGLATDDPTRLFAVYGSETLASNEGRPAASLAADAIIAGDHRRPLADRYFEVSNAIFSDGDSAAATRSVRAMAPLADGPLRSGAMVTDTERVAGCAVSLWRILQHDTRNVARAVSRLREVSPLRNGFGVWMNVCATILDAELSVELRLPDTTSSLARLDSLVRAGAAFASPLRVASILVLAELEERRGNLDGALAALRRRENNYNPRYLSTQLLAEARLATRLGFKSESIEAYRHYLALRFDPEPSLRDRIEGVRRELAALESGAGSESGRAR
jgi:DNA-binding SARP family transcriptional activator